MKRTLILTVLAGLLTAAAAGPALAAEHGDGIKVIPVDIWACTYNEGKGPADLDAATAKWNAWADSQGMDDYAAWTLTPWCRFVASRHTSTAAISPCL